MDKTVKEFFFFFFNTMKQEQVKIAYISNPNFKIYTQDFHNLLK